jgi:hypothetical protein
MSKPYDPVIVPPEVLVGLETMRHAGPVNMFDYQGVMYHAYHVYGLYHLVAWMADNREAYLHGIMRGFAVKTTEWDALELDLPPKPIKRLRRRVITRVIYEWVEDPADGNADADDLRDDLHGEFFHLLTEGHDGVE